MKKSIITNCQSIGKELKRLRIEKGLSQIEVADRISVSRSTITAYESERIIPAPDKLHDMAKLYGVEDEALFSLTSSDGKSVGLELPSEFAVDANDFLKCYRDMSDEGQVAIYDLIKDLYMEGLNK